MTDERGFWDIAQTGWFIAIVAATWGIILRAILAYRENRNKRTETRLSVIEAEIIDIKVSIASIAGRLLERDRLGKYTWPGDEK